MPDAFSVSFAAGLAIVAWLAHGHLPPGLGEGLAAAGLAVAVEVGELPHGLPLATLLLVLAGPQAGSADRPHERGTVVAQLALVAGVIGFARGVGAIRAGEAGGWLDLGILAVAALADLVLNRARHGWLPLLVPVAFAVLLRFAPEVPAPLAGFTWLIGPLGLLAYLLVAWTDTRRRIRTWLEEPERLVEPPPKHTVLYGVAVAIAGLGAIAALSTLPSFASFVALLGAMYAMFLVGHARQWPAVLEVGLALAWASVLSAVLVWTGPAGVYLAGAIATGFLLWLARFWEQQLCNAQSWTTAGGLVRPARRVVLVGSATLLALALLPDGAASTPLSVATLVVMCGLAALLSREARGTYGATAFASAALLLAAASLLGHSFAQALGWEIEPLLLVGGLGLLLVLAGGRTSEAVSNAWVAGALPVLAAARLSTGGASVQAVAALLCVALAIVLSQRVGAGAVSERAGA